MSNIKPVQTGTKTCRIKGARSGVILPRLSLGLWQNFGGVDPIEKSRDIIRTAFDLGITHFDLANNYGPPHGAAEETFGSVLNKDLAGYRDELFISSKAGYGMWAGPYGKGGSRKYLLASCDQSLHRLGVEYLDVFYSHLPDPDTPLEETMMALDHIVRSGRALYIGLSNYSPQETEAAIRILKELGTPMLMHQPRYSLFDRTIEQGLTALAQREGFGLTVFSPLAQGMLTNKYLSGIPEGSRAARPEIMHLNAHQLSQEKLSIVHKLNNMAENRGQTLAQMAIAWVLNNDAVTSAIIGASSVDQLKSSVHALHCASLPKLNSIRLTALSIKPATCN